jgi:hypothetical protein
MAFTLSSRTPISSGRRDAHRLVERAGTHAAQRRRHLGERPRERPREQDGQHEAERDVQPEDALARLDQLRNDLVDGPARRQANRRCADQPEHREHGHERDRDQEQGEPRADADRRRAADRARMPSGKTCGTTRERKSQSMTRYDVIAARKPFTSGETICCEASPVSSGRSARS